MPLRASMLLVLALLAAGCGFKHEPTGLLPAYPQTVRDALGREVVIDQAPKKIVSLDPGMSAAVAELGAKKLLVGRSGKETYPKSIMKVPIMTTTDGTPDVRALKKAQPDVILAPASMLPTLAEVNALQLKVGAVVYVVGGDSVAQVQDAITSLGLILARPDQGRKMAGDIQSQVDAVTHALAGQQPVKTFVDIGFLYTIDPGTMPSDLLRLAGGVNVAADGDSSQALTPAELQQAAPEVWLSVAGSGATLADLKHRQSLASIPAVQNGHVVEIPESVLYEDGPRVGLSLARVARALHPGLTISQ